MPGAPGYLIDTNILLRLSRETDIQNDLIVASLSYLDRQGFDLYFTMQNIAEFWNVSTRPIERNGYGLSADATNREIEAIERTMTLLLDVESVYSNWRELVLMHSVKGVQVHDARMVAVMQAYGVSHILTLNHVDFNRYPVQAVHPSELGA